MKNVSGTSQSVDLAELALQVLSISQSNAACERVFSHVRKVRIDFRSTIGVDNLESIWVKNMEMLSNKTVAQGEVF